MLRTALPQSEWRGQLAAHGPGSSFGMVVVGKHFESSLIVA